MATGYPTIQRSLLAVYCNAIKATAHAYYIPWAVCGIVTTHYNTECTCFDILRTESDSLQNMFPCG